MLFNFRLAPLQGIVPRRHPGNPVMSWFDLTQGEYWMRAGQGVLLEYSECARAAGAPRHCAYPVARLHEDLLGMLPYILDPVPAALVPYLAGERAAAWWEAYAFWHDANLASLHDARVQRIDRDARCLLLGRTLDTSYLAPLTSIVIWSDEESVHFAWDNRAGMLNGNPAWAADYGEFQMPRREFLAEVQSFHTRLIEAMEGRIEQVYCGALPLEIEVDLNGLLSDHEERGDALHDALSLQAQADWVAVERAIGEVAGATPGA